MEFDYFSCWGVQQQNKGIESLEQYSMLQQFTFLNHMHLTKIIRQSLSQQIKVPSVDISNFLTKTGNWKNDCLQIANIFRKYGLIIIKDPRVNAAQNDKFIDLMQRYFPKRSQHYYQGNRQLDLSPQTNYQTGLMYQYQQKFQSYEQDKLKLQEPYKPLTPLQPHRDPKWRFHWKVNMKNNVTPSDFPQWVSTMDEWGNNMKNGCLAISQMLAIGLDVEPRFLLDTIEKGDFMLSPTAVNLQKLKQGDVLAAFHRDFDLFTIHGKARFPGLYSWLNTGEKFMVNVPQGHLLIQAGKQLQWVTGGYITAGFHEVIYTKQVEQAKLRAKEKGKVLWRISSTMFCQMHDNVILKPHTKFATEQALKKYPQITAKEYLNQQLYALHN